MTKKYDYLVVGAGVFGAVFAREMTNAGKKCLVIDQNSHIGGHCYTKEVDGIVIHQYGPHIFHTEDLKIWEYVHQYCAFTPFCHRVKVNYRNQIFSFPINLMTLYQLWGVKTPEEASQRLEAAKIPNTSPQNLEEWVLSQVGKEIYDIFIQGYTSKQWGRSPRELPAFIIKRLPIRLNFNDTYYNDPYQGIPVGGYTRLFENLLYGIELHLNENYFDKKEFWDQQASKVVFTGRIDHYYNYRHGELEYRTLRFENERLEIPDFQGTAVVNYTDIDIPFTRITEYKHFENKNLPYTIISKEFPDEWDKNKIPYYPVNTPENNARYALYLEESKRNPNIIFGGRLAEFKYYDMHQVIASALSRVKEELKQKKEHV